MDVGQRLQELQAEYGLSVSSCRALEVLLETISEDPLAPTSVRDASVAVDRHVADSLVALRIRAVREAAVIADLGSGAGVPGLVLAAALPGARVTLVESNGRKAGFIERAIAAAQLGNAVAVKARAESWAAGHGANDVVTARALARLPIVAEYAAPLLRLGGTLVAWTGERDLAVEGEAGRAAEILGLEPAGPVSVMPFRGADHHNLYLMSKVRETPSRFPRREGVARKRPLGRAGSAF